MDMSKAKSIVVPGELARGCMDRMKMSEPQFARLLNLKNWNRSSAADCPSQRNSLLP